MMAKFCAGSLLLVALSVPAILSAADAKSDTTPDAKQTAVTPAGSSTAPSNTSNSAPDTRTDNIKINGRVPSGWGKLGLTEVQKQAIYKVQATYDAQLDALRTQLSDLEAKRDADMRTVLTAAQQKQLGNNAEAKVAKKATAADAKNNAPPAVVGSTTKTSKTDPKRGASSADSSTTVAETTK
jgi:hypothetical protein